MTLCNWCGQQSQNELTCDWCKRQIKLPSAAPGAGSRVDLDFLKDSDQDKPGVVRVVAIVGCVLACIALVAFLLARPNAPSPTVATTEGKERRAIPTSGPSDAPRWTNPKTQETTFQTSNPGRPGPRFVRSTPQPNKEGTIPTTSAAGSVILLDNVELSMVALNNGAKQVMGRADVVNPTGRNVIDYRCELVWGSSIYSMSPMTGRRGSLRKVEQRAVRPRGRTSVQLVSQPIVNEMAGGPSVLRLTAWLDGPPNNSIDDYLIQLGR